MKTIANIIHHEKSPLIILDSKDNMVYYEIQNGYWDKWAWNRVGCVIYYENSGGYVNDSRGNEHEINCKHNPS